MQSTQKKLWTQWALFMALGLGFRIAYLILLRGGNVSMDVLSWNTVIGKLETGRNPYVETTALNWPPFWMTVLACVNWVHETFHFRINQIIQAILILAEAGLMGFIGIQLKNKGYLKHFIWIYSFNLVSVLLIVQHGNFDIFPAAMIFFFLRSLVKYLRTGESDAYFLAAFLLGVAIYMKTFPVALGPLLMLHASGATGSQKIRRTLLAGAIALFPIAIGLSTLYVLNPDEIQKNVFQYRSLPGFFGFTGVLNILGWDFTSYVRAFPAILALFFALSAWRSRLWLTEFKGDVEASVFALAASVLLFIQSFGSGFGTQYWMWTFPLLVHLTWVLNRIPKSIFIALIPATFAGYLFLYGSLETHGAIFMKFQATQSIKPWFHLRLSPGVGQATILLPLFVCYCVLLWNLWPKKVAGAESRA